MKITMNIRGHFHSLHRTYNVDYLMYELVADLK